MGDPDRVIPGIRQRVPFYTCVEWLNGITYGELCDWLKSIRPSWKPSEEQMDALAIVIDDYYHACTKGSDDKSKTLKTLFEQLKKL